MITEQWQALLQHMRNVLTEGKTLVVLGWRDSNHDPQTRQISQEGRVMFYHQAPSSLRRNVGLVISSRFIDHKTLERIKVRSETHPVVLSNGEIKRLLVACSDLLHPVAVTPLVVKTVALSDVVETPTPVVSVVPAIEMLTALLDQGLRKETKKMEQQPIDKFARLFKAEAEKSGNGLVSKNVVGEIRRTAGITTTNSMMVTEGWLEAVVTEGATNAGQYRATEKLLGHVGEEPPIESTDPLVRAQRLVAEKPAIEEQITLQKVVLLELEDKLKKIQSAEALLTQLEALMK